MNLRICERATIFVLLLVPLVLLSGLAEAANVVSNSKAREVVAVNAILKIAQGEIDVPSEVSTTLGVTLPEFEINKSDGVELRTAAVNYPSADISYLAYSFLAPNTPNQRVSLSYNFTSRHLCIHLETLRSHLPKLKSITEIDPFGPSYEFEIAGAMTSSVIIQFAGKSPCVDSIIIVQTAGAN